MDGRRHVELVSKCCLVEFIPSWICQLEASIRRCGHIDGGHCRFAGPADGRQPVSVAEWWVSSGADNQRLQRVWVTQYRDRGTEHVPRDQRPSQLPARKSLREIR